MNIARLSAAIALSIMASTHAQPVLAAPSLEFSEGFLIGGKSIDMQRYAHGNPTEAGLQRVDVMFNGQFLQTRDIEFIAVDASQHAVPCLSADLLRLLPLRAEYLDVLEARADAGGCVDLAALVEGATVTFDSAELRLAITLPHAAQARTARGYVAPAQRDAGINAAFVSYTANHYRNDNRNSSYLGIRAGLNLGDWRLRHRASFNHSARGTRHRILSSHLQRDVPAVNGQLLLGEGNTGGELFESVSFTGARLYTDERMLPDSLRGYAPTVRGIAEGNAVVSIRQNGMVIHEVTVAPGPFVIEDLYPTSFGGDLEVTVTEADGRNQRFTVNFSAVPQALREGASKFSASAGTLRDTGAGLAHLRFAEGTYARGLNNYVTAFGGVQLAEQYRAFVAGAALNTGFGAFGADITRSEATLHAQGGPSGNSVRVNYQRYVARTGTHVGLAAYRYSTEGFLTLNDLARAQSGTGGSFGRAKQRYQANLSQRLGESSNLYLSGGHVTYWDGSPRQNDFQLGFQSVVRQRVNYGVSALRYRMGNGRSDTRYALTLSVPLGRGQNAPRASSQVSHSAAGQQAQLGLSGSLGERQALTYAVSSNWATDARSSTNAHLDYQGRLATLNAGYSRAAGYTSQTFSASGTVVAHRNGINAGPPVGEGFALVQARGAEGARVGAGTDIRVARNGYALLPHISAYRWNTIDLDPSGLPLEVEMLQTSKRIAPTAGGIVRVPFEVRRERSLFIEATDALGQPLPFAARVQREDGSPAGAIGQSGVIHLRGAQDQGVLIVDPDGPQRCRLSYQMPSEPDAYGLSWTESMCAPLNSPNLQVEHTGELPVPTAG